MPSSSITGATSPSELASNYPPFSPPLYALDSALPSTTGGQTGAWRLTSTGWIPVVLNILKIIAWISSALLLAGVTGLLRKT